jgi:hypothetical protein
MFFGERLGLAFAPPCELAEFRAGGTCYRDTGAGFMTSHYDRLTDSVGGLIGFVLWALPIEAGVAAALGRLQPRPYLEPVAKTRDGSPLAFAVYLAGIATPDPESTGDQAFGGQCFEGEGGEFALSVNLDYLFGDGPGAVADLAALRAAPVEWLPLTDVREAARDA